MTDSLHRRADGRPPGETRAIRFTREAAGFAEGSCLVEFGSTRVLCAASVEPGVPGWRRGSGRGWVTAEYAMLPRATHQRTQRERGQVGGRTQEIQRLIGRSLRACVDMAALGDWTIRIDCDVLQADGGTRTAAISGGAIALHDACSWLAREHAVTDVFRGLAAAVSAGIVDDRILLDLDYSEDSSADVDLNVVALEDGGLIEVQGTAERVTFSPDRLAAMVGLASAGIDRILRAQRAALGS